MIDQLEFVAEGKLLLQFAQQLHELNEITRPVHRKVKTMVVIQIANSKHEQNYMKYLF